MIHDCNARPMMTPTTKDMCAITKKSKEENWNTGSIHCRAKFFISSVKNNRYR